MPAGLNCLVRVWRRTADTDDSVGGAMLTGTVAYSNVVARVTPRRPNMLLLAQGIETPRMFSCRLAPGTLVVMENDEIEVINPMNHQFYGKRLQVLGVTVPSMNPAVGTSELMVDCRHVVTSHA